MLPISRQIARRFFLASDVMAVSPAKRFQKYLIRKSVSPTISFTLPSVQA